MDSTDHIHILLVAGDVAVDVLVLNVIIFSVTRVRAEMYNTDIHINYPQPTTGYSIYLYVYKCKLRDPPKYS